MNNVLEILAGWSPCTVEEIKAANQAEVKMYLIAAVGLIVLIMTYRLLEKKRKSFMKGKRYKKLQNRPYAVVGIWSCLVVLYAIIFLVYLLAVILIPIASTPNYNIFPCT